MNLRQRGKSAPRTIPDDLWLFEIYALHYCSGDDCGS